MSIQLAHCFRSKYGLNVRLRVKQQGFALVLVLWVVSLLAIMAGSFALTMRRESMITSGIKNNSAAIATAEAGIAMAEMMLLHPEQNKRWRADGNLYQIDFGETHVRIRMFSESGKIDLNKADLVMLQSLMAQVPVDEKQQAKLVGAILDWRDQDDLLNIEGAEKKEYKDAGLKYGPRNKPFQTLEELQMVLGVDETVYNWLEPKATVYSGKAQVNLAVASKEVLDVLPNVDAGLLESFLATRLDNARNDLPPPSFGIGLAGAGGFGGQNDTISILSEAILPDRTSALISAVIAKGDANLAEPYKILKWKRNPISDQSLFTDEMTEILVKQYAEPELRN